MYSNLFLVKWVNQQQTQIIYIIYYTPYVTFRSSYSNSTSDPSWTITFTHCSNLERDNATMNHRHSLLIHQMNGVLQTGTTSSITFILVIYQVWSVQCLKCTLTIVAILPFTRILYMQEPIIYIILFLIHTFCICISIPYQRVPGIFIPCVHSSLTHIQNRTYLDQPCSQWHKHTIVGKWP